MRARTHLRLTLAQLATLAEWLDLVGATRGYLPRQVFHRATRLDEAHRHRCTALIHKGALVPVDERQPVEAWRYRLAPWAQLLAARYLESEAQS